MEPRPPPNQLGLPSASVARPPLLHSIVFFTKVSLSLLRLHAAVATRREGEAGGGARHFGAPMLRRYAATSSLL
jgi:hypothetical protein